MNEIKIIIISKTKVNLGIFWSVVQQYAQRHNCTVEFSTFGHSRRMNDNVR